MRRPSHFTVSGALCLLLLFASCAEKLSKQTGLTDADLFSRGQKKFADKKYDDAIEAFQALIERFPNSPLAGKAQLGLAEARNTNKDDVEAEVAYDDFLRLYPADKDVPYALFRKGEVLARQSGAGGRDPSKALEAIRAFALCRDKDPKGPFAEKAAAGIRTLRQILGDAEVVVVSHYVSRKLYVSAEARARRALADYGDTPAVPTLLSLLAQALEKEGKKEEAADVRKSLAEKFPGRKGKTP